MTAHVKMRVTGWLDTHSPLPGQMPMIAWSPGPSMTPGAPALNIILPSLIDICAIIPRILGDSSSVRLDRAWARNGPIDRWMDGLMDRWINGWMDIWMAELSDHVTWCNQPIISYQKEKNTGWKKCFTPSPPSHRRELLLLLALAPPWLNPPSIHTAGLLWPTWVFSSNLASHGLRSRVELADGLGMFYLACVYVIM